MIEDKRLSKTLLKNHFEWCKKNGRETKWYKEAKKQLSKVPKKTHNNSQ